MAAGKFRSLSIDIKKILHKKISFKYPSELKKENTSYFGILFLDLYIKMYHKKFTLVFVIDVSRFHSPLFKCQIYQVMYLLVYLQEVRTASFSENFAYLLNG